jgi:Nif-specific regulatory protein
MAHALLPLLEEVARACTRAAELDEVLGPVLRWLHDQAGLDRATLALLDEEQGRIRFVAAHGLTPSELRRAHMRAGEGLMGRVIAEGRPIGVPRISGSTEFVDWSGILSRGLDPAFAAAPLHGEAGAVGALGGYRIEGTPEDLARDLQVLSIVAALLAPLTREQLRGGALQRPELEGGHQLQPDDMIGRSKPMRLVYEQLGQVAGSTTTVLLRGESGTGKELAAKALHVHSPRTRGPFIKVNCAALPEGVIESELFGHERGSFTGATARRKGRFERARGGTLFLDEIGELSPTMQVKLLRVLQDGEFERIGGNEVLHSDARIIAATSRDLETMQAHERFRSDLYYRLNVFPVRIPALRERRADILLLADHFIDACNKAHGRSVRRVSTPAIDMLMAYHWPGNVRELENCVERAVLIARDDVIHGHHLPPTLQTAEFSGTERHEGLDASVAALQRELIQDALKSTRGNRAAAARKLAITERVMGLRIARLGIDPERFEPKT